MDYDRTLLIRFDAGMTLKSFSTASRAKSTAVKIEIDVTDDWALGMLMQELARIRAAQNKGKAPRSIPAAAEPALQAEERRLLEPPRRMITDGSGK